MPAYVVVEVDVFDEATYEKYKRLVPDTIEAHGGRYLARGGQVVSLEGAWQPKRLVILEFENLARAQEWWACSEYREPKRIRNSSARTRMIAVEGVVPS